MKSTREAIFQQKTQNQSIRGQISFGIQMQRIWQKRKTRNLQPKTWNKAEKTHSSNEGNYTHRYKEVITSFVHLCLNIIWTPGQWLECISKKSRSFSLLQRPETHFGHAHGHQPANLITASINIFQSTIVTLHEVEHQKTVNTKLGKQTIWFSEVIKEFCHYFGKNRLEDRKGQKVKIHCFPKA